MVRQKGSSRVIEKAEQRAAGLKMISNNLEVGNSLTLETYTAAIEQLRVKLEAYNSLIAKINVAKADLLELDMPLRSKIVESLAISFVMQLCKQAMI